ncbi:MAG TPA: amino-acid N-acetyltransferase [Gammaproteobacteria bacterium]|nr:amino-acid N-acetyltransferase [Gammaproteobacteria bacterium]
MKSSDNAQNIQWFRDAAPYINQHRGKTFVLYFSGAAVASPEFDHLIHDIGLLHALGIRLVLVHGARPQIEARLQLENIAPDYAEGLRITNIESLDAVLEATGRLRVIIEAKLSLSLTNTPMSGSKIRVCSGNFITAKPLGIRNGVNFQHTGAVRKVDSTAIQQLLDAGQCVLFSPVGYSPSGEVFNLRAEQVAGETAIALSADKLIILHDSDSIPDLPAQLTPQDITPRQKAALSAELQKDLECAVHAVNGGVGRAHLIDRFSDGSLLRELFTRDGSGTLISSGHYEDLRQARSHDVGGILELIRPMEQQGILLRRSREQLELEIKHFIVMERDGLIAGCAALFPYKKDQMGEIACIAIHPAYRGTGRGDTLLKYLEKKAREQGLQQVFVMSTQTMHWFIERGFSEQSLDNLPVEKATLYNYQRKSLIFMKPLSN